MKRLKLPAKNMELKKIAMQESGLYEYNRIAESIGVRAKNKEKGYPYTIFSTINDTLYYDNYEQAIRDFFSHPLADEIAVMNNGKWYKKYVRFLKNEKLEDLEKEIEHISSLASQDLRKRGYFEMKFKRDSYSKDRLELGFVELDNTLIVGEIKIHLSLVDLLQVHSTREYYYYNYGVFDPIEGNCFYF